MPPGELLHVHTVVRDALGHDLTEGVSHALVRQAPRRYEVIAAIQASLQLARVGHANPVAIEAELRVVHGVDDLDLRPIVQVDAAVVHLAHEDTLRAPLEELLDAVDVDAPLLVVDELGHELDERGLGLPQAIADEVQRAWGAPHRM